MFKLNNRVHPPPGSAVFSFDGEYSVVAVDFDLAGRKDDVRGSVVKVKEELEKAVGLTFR